MIHLVTACFIQFIENDCAFSYYLNQNLYICQAQKAYTPSMKSVIQLYELQRGFVGRWMGQ